MDFLELDCHALTVGMEQFLEGFHILPHAYRAKMNDWFAEGYATRVGHHAEDQFMGQQDL
jgi:hypothetical protein